MYDIQSGVNRALAEAGGCPSGALALLRDELFEVRAGSFMPVELEELPAYCTALEAAIRVLEDRILAVGGDVPAEHDGVLSL